MRDRKRWAVLALATVAVAVAVTLLLVHLIQRSATPAARWDPEPGAVALPTGQAELAHAAAEEKAAGRQAAGMLLSFYADSSDTYGDVVQAARRPDGRGVVVLREDFDTSTPLAELTRRLAADAASQGGAMTATPTTVAGEPAFSLQQTAADDGQVNVEQWFDHGGHRWVLDVMAPPADVAAVTGRVQLD